MLGPELPPRFGKAQSAIVGTDVAHASNTNPKDTCGNGKYAGGDPSIAH